MEVFVEHLGAMQFDIKARRHSVVCAAFYAAQYLKKKGLAKEGTRVRVTAEKVPAPPRLDNFRIEIDAPVSLNAEHKAGVEELPVAA